jgi:hypothetical protein
MADVTFWILAAVLAAILTLPVHREEIRNELDPVRPLQVAMKVCQAKADVGDGEFALCMHRAVPSLPASWPNTPGRR